MWNANRLSRRTLLQAFGVSVALPALDRMTGLGRAGVAHAAPALSTHTRVAYLFFPNGCPRQLWEPTKLGADGALETLGPVMQALTPLRDRLTVIGHLWTPTGMGHVNGTATWLTGEHYRRAGDARGAVSADQLLAGLFAPTYRVPALTMALDPVDPAEKDPARCSISWRGGGVPVPRDVSPRTVFDTLFRPTQDAATQEQGAPGPKPLVMDAVAVDAKTLTKSSGADDRARLGRYFESIHALEKRVLAAEAETRAARADGAKSDTGRAPVEGVPIGHETHIRLLLDSLALAFEADITRVGSLMFGGGREERYLSFLPDVVGHWHALSHYKHIDGTTKWDDGESRWPDAYTKLGMFERVVRWYMRQVAHFLGRLNDVVEPDGNTLLDNSMVLCGSAMGDGHWHKRTHLPTFLAGRGGGTIRSGRFIENVKRVDLSAVHTAILQRMGLPIPAFGTADGPITSL